MPEGIVQREGEEMARAPQPSGAWDCVAGRVLLHLVQNALEATPERGQLTLRGPGTATHVQLQVQETGSGIPAGELARIFEPLYTTKPGGTGLGLSIVQEIVQAHGGEVTVESASGQGTLFTLTVPR
jgi:two-component system sensor histidine kinase HydH